MKYKMSDIVQATRPSILEEIQKKYRHMQPFLKQTIHKAAYDAIEGALIVIRNTEVETDAKNKDPQHKTAAGN